MVSSDYYIEDNSDIENKKLEAARSHYMSGNYSAALKLYLSLINTNISYKLYHRIGKCYYKMGDFSKAEEYFIQSVGLEKLHNPSYVYLGNINFKNNNSNKAIYYWCYAYASKPEDASLFLNIATTYFAKGMNFQSVYYYKKYLKHAKNKTDSYNTIKSSIDKCSRISEEFYKKAKDALIKKDDTSAIEFLNYALKNMPVNFDTNYLLGSIYLNKNDNMHAMIYLKQALFIDNKSMEALQKLASAQINLGDYTASYCTLRRLLPLVMHNQDEYLKTLKIIKELGDSFDNMSYQGHKEWGDRYFEDNNYHSALIEYENCIFLNENIQDELQDRINLIKLFLNPEAEIIRTSLELGSKLYREKKFQEANKYFTKVMTIADSNSQEYKTAKSRVINV